MKTHKNFTLDSGLIRELEREAEDKKIALSQLIEERLISYGKKQEQVDNIEYYTTTILYYSNSIVLLNKQYEFFLSKEIEKLEAQKQELLLQQKKIQEQVFGILEAVESKLNDQEVDLVLHGEFSNLDTFSKLRVIREKTGLSIADLKRYRELSNQRVILEA